MKLVAEAVKYYFDRGSPAMTAEDRRRMTKVRKGGEKYIPKLARAAVASGVTPSGYSIDEMTASAALVQKLEPLEETLSTLLKLVQDARFRASGATWTTATLVYAMLKPVAARDGKVATAIAPVKGCSSRRASRARRRRRRIRERRRRLRQRRRRSRRRRRRRPPPSRRRQPRRTREPRAGKNLSSPSPP